MKKPALSLFLIALALGFSVVLLAQNIQHVTGTVNIEIPVRVFKGPAFIDSLTIEDFEVYEDGKLQTVEAVYLVKKTNIERREENVKHAPETARHFYLFFELGDYDPKIREAVEYFVKEVLIPGDNLIIVTPMKTYRMKAETFTIVGRDKIFDQLIGILRRDIQIGYSEYRNLVRELKSMARLIASQAAGTSGETIPGVTGDPLAESPSIYAGASIEEQLQIFSTLMAKLERLRVMDQGKLLSFAEHLREQEGHKGVFLFYQREFLPKLDPKVMNIFMTNFNERPDFTLNLSGIFENYRREFPIDVDLIKKAFSDSSTAIHFLYIAAQADRAEGIVMEESSEDVFVPMMEMARATGGFADTSMNIGALMKSAVTASENYYLLYYTPRDYQADGRFRNLEVRVKGGGYRISHRLGYIAD